LPDWCSTGAAAPGWAALEPELARLVEHQRQPGRGGQLVGRAEAGQVAGVGEELRGQDGAHPGQALDQGGVGMLGQQPGQVTVELGQPGPAGQRLAGQLPDQSGGQLLARDAQLLGGRGGKGLGGQALALGAGQAAAGQVVLEPAGPATRTSAGVT
jgi:hypothetical protein